MSLGARLRNSGDSIAGTYCAGHDYMGNAPSTSAGYNRRYARCFFDQWINNTMTTAVEVGAETAYAGFPGGTGGAASIQAVTAWTYTASPGQQPTVAEAPTNLRVH